MSVYNNSNLENIPFNDAVSFGMIPGYTRVGALGNNPDVDIITVPEDIWATGGVYPWPTEAVTLEILSSSANDTAAGTGARTVMINYLDINYKALTQIVILNGVTPVALASPIFRLNLAVVISAGTSGTNEGAVIIRRSGAGATQATILTGVSVTRQSIYTVPAGFSLIVKQILFDVQSPSGTIARAADMVTYFRSAAGVSRKPLVLSTTNALPYNHTIEPGIFLAEKTDFSLQVTFVSDNNTSITGAWNGILKDNTVN